ncbi:probable LRR receptor-like serine/threonine-protein kinase At5g45780 [Helianthus annuus]|uniref:probable LRR receptor-like serine/threonine-protein kinase At5g45780 n=1 Tax=Helianthus annuus TaxID=4232 RepID=UPI00165321BA|nr:probable LRR receptor-like serine/threonine-protein kinase At5g45780 [Helianthus annuus]
MPESSPLMMMSSSGFFLRRFRHQIYWVQLLDGVVSDVVSDASKKKKAVASAKRGVQALMNIKNGLDDPHSVLNWDADAVDPCSWTMITFSLDKFVIGFRFALVQSKNKGCQGGIFTPEGQISRVDSRNKLLNSRKKTAIKRKPEVRFCYQISSGDSETRSV